MADVTLKIGADAKQASNELGKLEGDVKGLGDSFKGLLELGGLTAAFAGLTGIIGNTIADFKEAEQIGNKLNQALVNQGMYSTDLKAKYEDLAGAIQKKTRFGDDDVKAGLAVAQGFLGQMEITDDLTRAVTDLAEAQGMDLQSAFMLVGKSLGGPTNALSRYGISIDKTKSKAEQMEEVTRNLNQAFGGQAEAAAQGLGALDKLGNAFGEISESVGKAFAPAVSAAAEALADIAFWISENEEITEWVAILLGAATAIVGVTTAIVGVNFALATFGATLATVALPVTAVVAAVVGLGAAWKYNFLGIQEVMFGVVGALKVLLNSMMDNLLATGKVLIGLLTFDMAMIKEGMTEYVDSIKDVVGKTIAAYKVGHDQRLKDMAAEDTAEADLIKKSQERSKTRKAVTSELTKEQLKALEEREKSEERAAKARFDREQKGLESAIDNIIDEEDASADSLERIAQDREEFEGIITDLHTLRLTRIDELKLADVERIEAIKDAEAQLDEAKRKYDSDEKTRISNLESLNAKKADDAAKAAQESRKELIEGLQSAYAGLITAGQDVKNFFGGNFLNTIRSFIEDFANIPKSLLTAFEDFDGVLSGVPADLSDIEAKRADFEAKTAKDHEENIKRIKEKEEYEYDRIIAIKEAEAELKETRIKFDAEEAQAKADAEEKAVKPLATQIVDATAKLAELVPKIAQTFAKEFPNIVNQFVKAMPAVADAIVGALPMIVQDLADAAPKIVGAFMDALTAIAQNLPEILGPLIEAIPEVIGRVLEGLPDLILAVMDALPDLIVMLVEAIPSIVEKLADNIGPIAEALVEGLIVGSVDIVIGLIDALLFEGGLERIVGALLRAIPRLAIGIVEGLANAMGSLLPDLIDLLGSAFSEAIPAIGEAINDAFMWVGEQLQDFFGGIFGPFNDAVNMLSETPSWIEWLQDLVDDLYNAIDSVSGGGEGSGEWYDPRSYYSTGTNKVPAPRYASVGAMFPGSPRATDMIPTWTAPGEAVINARSVAANPTAVAQLQGAGGPVGGGSDNVIRLVPADAIGRAVADWLVQSSALGTGSLRFSVGSES